jgi:hypothetical protein
LRRYTQLCERKKNHRMTLQLCVWDQIREIDPRADGGEPDADDVGRCRLLLSNPS